METIPSFKKDHDTMKEGLYISMEMKGITTFDLRFKKPNTEFLTTAVCHTIEHIIATLLRNSAFKDDIIYFGPMGCRTGFYLLTVDMTKEQVKNLLIEAFSNATTFTEIPGAKKVECGNYLDHDLEGAKVECEKYLKVLKSL